MRKKPVRYRIPASGLRAASGQVFVNHQLPGLALRYTIDGRNHSINSPLVSGPLQAKGVVNVAAFDRNGRRVHIAHIELP
jgi:hexosaminidase